MINRSLRDYISKQESDCLKGLFSLCVVACHLRGQISFFNNSLIGQILTVAGYLSVAVFFFFSGYGLTLSSLNKGKDYVKHFPKRRLLPFYCNYLIAVVIYLIFHLLSSKSIEPKLLLKSFTFGGTYVAGGWYLQTILLIYIAFYLISRFSSKHKILLLQLFVLFYIAVCIIIFDSTLQYESILAFLLGVIWATSRQSIDELLSKRMYYFIYLFSSTIIFVLTLLCGNTSFLRFDVLRVISKMMSAVAFVLVVNAVVMKIRFSNIITRMLGNIYFEIYITHGIFLGLYHSKFIYINNALVYIAMVVVSTLIASLLLHILFKSINNLCLKSVKTNE